MSAATQTDVISAPSINASSPKIMLPQVRKSSRTEIPGVRQCDAAIAAIAAEEVATRSVYRFGILAPEFIRIRFARGYSKRPGLMM
jgi:hypothetical protein